MAFENVQISSTLNAGPAVLGFRQNAAIGDIVVVSLSDNTGVTSYRWQMVGRPEGSVAGGAGPEPIELGIASSAQFQVDDDSLYPRDGSYKIVCVVNEGTPTETRIKTVIARLSGLTTPDGRVLRMPAPFETDEDTADFPVRQGFAKQVNRWLRLLASLSGGGGASDTLDLQNLSGYAVDVGTPVWISGSGWSAFFTQPALAAFLGDEVLVGVVADPIINNGAIGKVQISGLAQVKVAADSIGILSPPAPPGRQLFAHPTLQDWASMNPPDGYTVAPIGFILAPQAYDGSADGLVAAVLTGPTRAARHRVVSGELAIFGSAPVTVNFPFIAVPPDTTIWVEYDILAYGQRSTGGPSDDASWRLLVKVRNDEAAGGTKIIAVKEVMAEQDQTLLAVQPVVSNPGVGLAGLVALQVRALTDPELVNGVRFSFTATVRGLWAEPPAVPV